VDRITHNKQIAIQPDLVLGWVSPDHMPNGLKSVQTSSCYLYCKI